MVLTTKIYMFKQNNNNSGSNNLARRMGCSFAETQHWSGLTLERKYGGQCVS